MKLFIIGAAVLALGGCWSEEDRAIIAEQNYQQRAAYYKDGAACRNEGNDLTGCTGYCYRYGTDTYGGPIENTSICILGARYPDRELAR